MAAGQGGSIKELALNPAVEGGKLRFALVQAQLLQMEELTAWVQARNKLCVMPIHANQHRRP